jgi:hypothetical protein
VQQGHEDSAASGEQRLIHPEAGDSCMGVGPVLFQGGPRGRPVLRWTGVHGKRNLAARGRKEREEKGWAGWAKAG